MPVAALGAAIAGLSTAAAIAGSATGVLTLLGGSLIITPLIGGILAGLGSFALAGLQMALAPKPKAGGGSGLRGRTIQVREPLTPHRLVYGMCRVSGPIIFMEATDGAGTKKENFYLHMVIMLAAHEVQEIGTVQLNDYCIYNDMLDADGVVTKGRYTDKVRIRKQLGAPGQTADTKLVTETSLTATDVGFGRAYLYIRYEFVQELFAGSLPNVSAWVRGKKVYDPRSAATAWSQNPVLFIRDYLTMALDKGGAGIASSDMDDTETTASANVCEELVAVDEDPVNVLAVNITDNTLSLDTLRLRYQYGDVVRVSSDGTIPAGLSAGTDYYPIPWHESQNDPELPDVDTTHEVVMIKLATSFANAVSKTAIDITSAGSGAIKVTKTSEPRYASSGAVDLSMEPSQIIDNMRSAMAGRIYPIGGAWQIRAGYYTAPTITLGLGDLRASMSVVTRQSRRERFNAIKGVFASPDKFWMPGDYPSVVSSVYRVDDDNIRIYRDFDLPFTTRPFTAQRIAKIELERHRREILVDLPCKLSALRLKSGDTVMLTMDRLGWSSKIFEIVELNIVPDEDANGMPYLGVNLSVREFDSSIFDWSIQEQGAFVEQQRTLLPRPFQVITAGAPAVTEENYITRSGDGVKTRANMTWTESSDSFVLHYRPEYKLSSASQWTPLPQTMEARASVEDIAPGTYDFRVFAINTIGLESDPATATNVVIVGLSAPPTAPQNITLSVIGNAAMIRWDRSPDADVRIGGRFIFRHSPAQVGATWDSSTSIGDAIPGSETVALLPLLPGTYLVKAEDSLAIRSASASSISTSGATVLQYTTSGTITEHPAFSGVKVDMGVSGGVLSMEENYNSIDAWGAIDSVADWDTEGFLSRDISGTYHFATKLDLGSVQRVRLRKTLTASVALATDLIDSRSGNVDTWESWDGTIPIAAGDAILYVRTTSDDPNAAPTWSVYNRLDCAEFQARGFDFELNGSIIDQSYEISITELSVTAENVV